MVWHFVRHPVDKSVLGVLANYEKWLLTSLCLSFPLYARKVQLLPDWTYFHEILYLSIFRKSVEKKPILVKTWQE